MAGGDVEPSADAAGSSLLLMNRPSPSAVTLTIPADKVLWLRGELTAFGLRVEAA